MFTESDKITEFKFEIFQIKNESKAPVSQLVNAEENRRVTVKPRGGGGTPDFK